MFTKPRDGALVAELVEPNGQNKFSIMYVGFSVPETLSIWAEDIPSACKDDGHSEIVELD